MRGKHIEFLYYFATYILGMSAGVLYEIIAKSNSVPSQIGAFVLMLLLGLLWITLIRRDAYDSETE